MTRQPRKWSYKKLIGIVVLILFLSFGYGYVRKARAAAALEASNRGLQQIIDTWATQQSFNSSVVVTGLNGDQHIAGRNTASQIVTASTYKLFVAYATLHEVEQGKYTMNTRLGTGQTVNSALQKMILYSDNDSGKALGLLVGWQRADQLAAEAGATNTFLNNYDKYGNLSRADKHTTATDLATLIDKLEDGTLLNASDTQLLLGLMKTQIHRERIPAGVPDSVAVADKPGWLLVSEGDGENIENDAAVVYGPKATYSLVIMTDGNSTQALADLSQLVYNYLEQ